MTRVGSSITQISEHVRFHNHANTIFLSFCYSLSPTPTKYMHTIYSVDCSDNRGTVDVFNFNAIYMWLGSMVSLHIHNLRGECDTPGPGSIANVIGTTQCKKQLFTKTGI